MTGQSKWNNITHRPIFIKLKPLLNQLLKCEGSSARAREYMRAQRQYNHHPLTIKAVIVHEQTRAPTTYSSIAASKFPLFRRAYALLWNSSAVFAASRDDGPAPDLIAAAAPREKPPSDHAPLSRSASEDVGEHSDLACKNGRD